MKPEKPFFLTRVALIPAHSSISFYVTQNKKSLNDINTLTLFSGSSISCTCTRYNFLFGSCKHITFIMNNVLQMNNETWIRYSKVNKFERIIKTVFLNMMNTYHSFLHPLISNSSSLTIFSNMSHKLKSQCTDDGINETCLVCLNTRDSNKENVHFMYCKRCTFAVHEECWFEWCISRVRDNNTVNGCEVCNSTLVGRMSCTTYYNGGCGGNYAIQLL